MSVAVAAAGAETGSEVGTGAAGAAGAAVVAVAAAAAGAAAAGAVEAAAETSLDSPFARRASDAPSAAAGAAMPTKASIQKPRPSRNERLKRVDEEREKTAVSK